MINLLVKNKLSKIALVLLFVLFFANSLAISYTVQVIALSSEANVKLLEERLRDLGFPAYTITVPTNQGQIFRLRVGSFANREAAQKYAQAMQGILDSAPVPQLAEGIPLDLVPLEAKTIASYPIEDTIVGISSDKDRIIIRIQSLGSFKEASYIIEDFSFNAYRAVLKTDDKLLRVYSKRLWPEVYPLDSTTERDAFYKKTISELVNKLGITSEEIARHQFANANAEPFLVLLEQIDLNTKEVKLLKALGKPNSRITEYGPELDWFDSEVIELKEKRADIELGSNYTPKAELKTDTWIASSRDKFTQLEIIDTKQKWLVVAGQVLWAQDNLLITRYQGRFEIYSLK